MSQLQNNLREILRQKNQYLAPYNIRQGVNVLGVSGTLEEKEIKLFTSKQQMNNYNSYIGDKSVLYYTENKPIDKLTVFKKLKFNENVTLDEEIEFPEDVQDLYYSFGKISYRDTNADLYINIDGHNEFIEVNINLYSSSGDDLNITYTTEDNIHFTMNEPEGNLTPDWEGFYNIDTKIKYRPDDGFTQWTDAISKFIDVKVNNFGGLFEYKMNTNGYFCYNTDLTISYLNYRRDDVGKEIFDTIEDELNVDLENHGLYFFVDNTNNIYYFMIAKDAGDNFIGMEDFNFGVYDGYFYVNFNSYMTIDDLKYYSYNLTTKQITQLETPTKETITVENYTFSGYKIDGLFAFSYWYDVSANTDSQVRIYDVDNSGSQTYLYSSEENSIYYSPVWLIADNQFGLGDEYYEPGGENYAKLLEGNYAYGQNGVVEGTIKNNGYLEITPSSESQYFDAGYYDNIYVENVSASVDENIQSQNILRGVSILNVDGSLNVDEDIDLANSILLPPSISDLYDYNFRIGYTKLMICGMTSEQRPKFTIYPSYTETISPLTNEQYTLLSNASTNIFNYSQPSYITMLSKNAYTNHYLKKNGNNIQIEFSVYVDDLSEYGYEYAYPGNIYLRCTLATSEGIVTNPIWKAYFSNETEVQLDTEKFNSLIEVFSDTTIMYPIKSEATSDTDIIREDFEIVTSIIQNILHINLFYVEVQNPEVLAFNAQFMVFDGTQSGNNVKSLLDICIENANNFRDNDDKLPDVNYTDFNGVTPLGKTFTVDNISAFGQRPGGDTIVSTSANTKITAMSQLRRNITSAHQYQITMTVNDTTGYISLIKIYYGDTP